MEKEFWTERSLVISVPILMIVIPLVVALITVIFSIVFLWKSKTIFSYSNNQHMKIQNESSRQVAVSKRQLSRIEEEHKRQKSSEYTRRGQIWSRHASWYLPKAPRYPISVAESHGSGVEPIKALLRKFDIDMVTGFLPAEEPLQRLPYARYHIWEDLGDDLPSLLGARLGQARGPLEQLPVLSIDKLTTSAELRRAHLLLCLFAHAYVFGGNEPLDVLPAGISVPLSEVSAKLGIPPVLGHPSIVLYNWRRLDRTAAICMENLATLNNFFDGRDESWFYLITVEVEARGAGAIVPTMLAIDAIQRYREQQDEIGSDTRVVGIEDEEDCDGSNSDSQASTASEADEVYSTSQRPLRYEALLGVLSVDRVAKYVAKQLVRISTSIEAMGASMSAMREGCHPFIFYHRVRPFLSGWKHNPALPQGVLYSEVSAERQMYYGGSAAQSALIPVLDIALGVAHDSHKSKDFLLAMRDYMLQPHREFLVHLENVANIRDFVMEMQQRYLTVPEAEERVYSSSDVNAIQQSVQVLVSAYDSSVTQLRNFRTIHMSLVADYIMAQQRGGVAKPKVSADTVSQEVDAVREEASQLTAPLSTTTSAVTATAAPKKGLEHSAGGKGTGGTDLMNFLRPIRDDCKARYSVALLSITIIPIPTPNLLLFLHGHHEQSLRRAGEHC